MWLGVPTGDTTIVELKTDLLCKKILIKSWNVEMTIIAMQSNKKIYFDNYLSPFNILNWHSPWKLKTKLRGNADCLFIMPNIFCYGGGNVSPNVQLVIILSAWLDTMSQWRQLASYNVNVASRNFLLFPTQSQIKLATDDFSIHPFLNILFSNLQVLQIPKWQSIWPSNRPQTDLDHDPVNGDLLIYGSPGCKWVGEPD